MIGNGPGRNKCTSLKWLFLVNTDQFQIYTLKQQNVLEMSQKVKCDHINAIYLRVIAFAEAQVLGHYLGLNKTFCH